MSEGITTLSLAEELHAARHNIEATVVLLRSQLQGMKDEITTASGELEKLGISASMNSLDEIGLRAQQIERQVRKLRKQKTALEEAIVLIRKIQTAK